MPVLCAGPIISALWLRVLLSCMSEIHPSSPSSFLTPQPHTRTFTNVLHTTRYTPHHVSCCRPKANSALFERTSPVSKPRSPRPPPRLIGWMPSRDSSLRDRRSTVDCRSSARMRVNKSTMLVTMKLSSMWCTHSLPCLLNS